MNHHLISFKVKAQRFIISGVLATMIHVVVAAALIEFINLNPSLANGIAFLCAAVFSYTINTCWSFSSSIHGRTMFRFGLVSVLGSVFAMIISGLSQQAGTHYLTGIAIVAITAPAITFLLHNYWTYR